MLDQAQIGHNNPPAYDLEAFADLDTQVGSFMDATKVWLDLETIETEIQAEQLSDQIDGLRGLHKRIDTARKDAKRPHDDAGKAVQQAFTPLLEKLKLASDTLKVKLGDYTKARAAEEERQRAAAQEEADRRAREAEAAKAAAEANNDLGAKIDAEQAAEKAKAAQEQAAKPVDTQVKSASGAGRTKALRTVKEVEVTSARLLFLHYQNQPQVIELLKRLATAEVRAAGFDEGKTPIPGIQITERKVLA